ncbi:hypothetical protein [Bacillus rubiinfantis]|nr:hypothetical protein [Bacillus rubiinfantis]
MPSKRISEANENFDQDVQEQNKPIIETNRLPEFDELGTALNQL